MLSVGIPQYRVPGFRKIKLAKKAEAKPKQIKVNVGGEKTVEVKTPGRAA
jgi:HSP20 family protein